MGRDEMMDSALAAYEESTGGTPDTRDFVALEDAVDNYLGESSAESKD